MTAEKVDFTGIPWGSVQWTMLGTLYLRAYDARSDRPILNDRAAAEAVDRITYDFPRLHKLMRPASNRFLVALRARQFDNWATAFLDRHPDAVVLHLGCGLDSRAFRLHLPDGVRWYDVDVPAVIDLRRQVYPERDGYQMIGTSVTEPEWLGRIPSDRPTLILAEGLFPYLRDPTGRDLVRRLTEHCTAGGELQFDALSRWVMKLGAVYRQGKIYEWGLDDARDVERWSPRLTFQEEVSGMAHSEWIPVTGYRLLYRVVNALPGVKGFDRQLRFTF